MTIISTYSIVTTCNVQCVTINLHCTLTFSGIYCSEIVLHHQWIVTVWSDACIPSTLAITRKHLVAKRKDFGGNWKQRFEVEDRANSLHDLQLEDNLLRKQHSFNPKVTDGNWHFPDIQYCLNSAQVFRNTARMTSG